jgi:uncharacterized protein YcfJ
MNTKLQMALGVAGLAMATAASAQVTFYEGPDFRGPSFTADRPMWNLERSGFNDRASSARVQGGTWQVCEDARFEGRCVVLQPGEYYSLRDMGLNNRVSSVRPVDNYGNADAPRIAGNYNAPPPVVAQGGYDYRRRNDERVYDVPVTSVRAVVGPPEQRCWVERQDVVQDNGGGNVPGAVIGGVIGGILGHQVGGGRGNTAATIGGAAVGAAIGGNVNRDAGGQGVYSQDVQRCAYAPRDARPDYWDVTYSFRGVEHHVQMASPPGSTITVNPDGEPRM